MVDTMLNLVKDETERNNVVEPYVRRLGTP
jgi:hypothetical protein